MTTTLALKNTGSVCTERVRETAEQSTAPKQEQPSKRLTEEMKTKENMLFMSNIPLTYAAVIINVSMTSGSR